MSIAYKYEIIAVDAAARCMEVVYSAEGRPTMHIGARLPFEGESLEKVIGMYAPVSYWIEQERSVVIPQVGASGVVVPATEQELLQTRTAEDQFGGLFPTPPTGSIGTASFE
jgi:hypothetical protein